MEECIHLQDLRAYLHHNQLVIHAGYEKPDDDGSVIVECTKCETLKVMKLHEDLKPSGK